MNIQFHHSDRPAALHGRDELHRYLSTPVHVPEILTQKAHQGLSDPARAAYNRARMVYLSGGIVFATPTVRKAEVLLTKSFAENIGRNSGHAGLMLSGDGTVGKTTTAKALMKYVFAQYKRQFPEFEREDKIPVMYVKVPAGSTGKLLMKTFANFLGLPEHRSETMVDIRNRVVDCINRAGTQLIVVDELQNLAGKTLSNGESVDVLKDLHNDLAATFVYAGINLTQGSVLAGPRGRQLSGRFNLLELERFTRTNAGDRKAWVNLIKAFESSLPLRDHEVGSLAEHADYLFDRTNGSIGSLSRLITGAAIEIIATTTTTTEAVTLPLLRTQVLDIAAEDHYRNSKRKPSNRGSGSAMLDTLVTK